MNSEYINLNQKKEWRAVDFCKLICAFLVVGIHYAAFSDISVELSFFVRNTENRLAVPFFLLHQDSFLKVR